MTIKNFLEEEDILVLKDTTLFNEDKILEHNNTDLLGEPLPPHLVQERDYDQSPSHVTEFTTTPSGFVIKKPRRGRPPNKNPFKHVKNKHYSIDAKFGAVTAYLATGNMRTVSEICAIDYETLKAWRRTPWWKDLTQQIQSEQQDGLDAKMTKILDKSLKVINDRLEHGDFAMTKSGEIIRKPMTARDTVSVVNTVFDKQRLIRNQATSITETQSVEDRLKSLAEEFTKFANATTINGKTGEVE